jgi:glycosyltransferase involved in cell wall biosynthesis
MRVLWFAVTPSLYGENTVSHNGGGWIASLERIIRTCPEIELGIAFEHKDHNKTEKEGVVYYPLNVRYTRYDKLHLMFDISIEEKSLMPHCINVIDDFKPDIIQVFGSEWSFGLIQKYTNIPVVIHMQGSIPPYHNAAYPPGYNFYNKLIFNKFRMIKSLGAYLSFQNEKQRVVREEKILRMTHFFMGRTDWDLALTKLYSPLSKYFYCSEALRPIFINDFNRWKYKNKGKKIFVTTGSGNLLKGLDAVLKTAKLLIDNTSMDFEWHLIGPNLNTAFIEKMEKINAKDVNVILRGVLNEEELNEELINADLYIHTSYIDNSPNSLCEAQCLGVPVIATNVGGIPSLIAHKETGVLVPANDPYSLAYNIQMLCNNREYLNKLSQGAYQEAQKRHSPANILNDIISNYNSILSETSC